MCCYVISLNTSIQFYISHFLSVFISVSVNPPKYHWLMYHSLYPEGRIKSICMVLKGLLVDERVSIAVGKFIIGCQSLPWDNTSIQQFWLVISVGASFTMLHDAWPQEGCGTPFWSHSPIVLLSCALLRTCCIANCLHQLSCDHVCTVTLRRSGKVGVLNVS